jgi:hypothetical protein
MKRCALIVAAAVISVACGGSPKSESASSTQIPGAWAWTITSNEVGLSANALSVTLVASQCSLSTPVGTFTVEGPICFTADDDTRQGSISGTGQFLYPPQSLLVGSSTNPLPSNTTATIDLLFVEEDQYGDVAVFNGNGSISNGVATGTWACNPSSPACSGLSGTFSGSQN